MRVEDACGPIDVLVNTAGAAQRTPPDELTPAWRAAIDAKFFSYVNVIDPLVKRMAERGAGVIVNVIGDGGKVASPTHLAGGSANAALMLATAGLGAAYAASGVRVVGVSPGLTETDRVADGLAAEAQSGGRQPRGGAAAQRRQDPDRPAGAAARNRRGRRLSRFRQGELRHGRDALHGRRPEPRRALTRTHRPDRNCPVSATINCPLLLVLLARGACGPVVCRRQKTDIF